MCVQRNTSCTQCLHAYRCSQFLRAIFHLHSHFITRHTMRGSSARSCPPQNCPFQLHDMNHPLMHSTQTTSSQFRSSTSPLLLSSSSPRPGLLHDDLLKPCEDPRQDGRFTNLHSSTGHEPKKVELDKNVVNQQIDDQDYMEEISVEQLAVAHQPMTYSAYDSAESIALDSDLDNEHIRRMLASPL